MRIDLLTLFPDMCESVLNESVIGRARKAGKIELACTNIRDFTLDKHNRVDDTPYGGGKGMIMQAEPIYRCYQSVCTQSPVGKPHLIYMTPQGNPLTQNRVKELAQLPHIAILCGHYEGVDERVVAEIVDEEISIGDYVLTGGELPALVLADSIARLQPGVLADEACFREESHYQGLLEYPQYTRPYDWHGMQVPEVLVSGHHANIARWRREQSLLRTWQRRPDLLKQSDFTKKERDFLDNLKKNLDSSVDCAKK